MMMFENHANGRYYCLMIERDLLDDCVLVVIRGGLLARVTRRVCHGSPAECQKKMQKMCKRRISRGYSLVNTGIDHDRRTSEQIHQGSY